MNRNFSLDDFKKWIETQQELKPIQEENIEGKKVKSKISLKKLSYKIESEDEDKKDLAKDFAKNGGMVLELNENRLLISVDSGSFYLDKKYVD